MAAKKTTQQPTERARQIYNNVLANFKKKGTSFNAHCEQNGLHRGNSEKALLGTWNSKKARALRSQLIQASKAKP